MECAIEFCDAPDGEGLLPVCPNGHFMHDSCAARWMSAAPLGRPTCPLCRDDCLDRFARVASEVASRRATEEIEKRLRELEQAERRQKERLLAERDRLQKERRELEEEKRKPTDADLERLLREREAAVAQRERQVRSYLRPMSEIGGGGSSGYPLTLAFASPPEFDAVDGLSRGERAWRRFEADRDKRKRAHPKALRPSAQTSASE